MMYMDRAFRAGGALEKAEARLREAEAERDRLLADREFSQRNHEAVCPFANENQYLVAERDRLRAEQYEAVAAIEAIRRHIHEEPVDVAHINQLTLPWAPESYRGLGRTKEGE